MPPAGSRFRTFAVPIGTCGLLHRHCNRHANCGLRGDCFLCRRHRQFVDRRRLACPKVWRAALQSQRLDVSFAEAHIRAFVPERGCSAPITLPYHKQRDLLAWDTAQGHGTRQHSATTAVSMLVIMCVVMNDHVHHDRFHRLGAMKHPHDDCGHHSQPNGRESAPVNFRRRPRWYS